MWRDSIRGLKSTATFESSLRDCIGMLPKSEINSGAPSRNSALRFRMPCLTCSVPNQFGARSIARGQLHAAAQQCLAADGRAVALLKLRRNQWVAPHTPEHGLLGESH